MRRLRLSTWLIGLNVGLLLLAIAGVASVAVRTLQQLAEQQALARVTQAGQSAQNALRRAGDEALIKAQLLAERPTLARLLESGTPAALTDFLAQYQRTSQLNACVLFSDRLIARSGLPLPAQALETRVAADQPLITISDGSFIWLIASAPLASRADLRVITAQRLDEELAQALSAEVGLPVRLLAAPLESPSALQTQTLNSAAPMAGSAETPDRYVGLQPVLSADGLAVGLIEVELAATDITRSTETLTRTFLWLALGVALWAALASLWLGQRLGRPLRTLAESAIRIGHGDFTTRVASLTSGAEVDALAQTLEEMRRQLLSLMARLERERAESAAIVNGINEGIFAVDRERRIEYVNPQMSALLGLPAQAILGRFCGDVLNPRGPDGGRPCAEQCPILHARFRAGARAAEQLVLRNGQRRTVIITSAPPAEAAPGDLPFRQVQMLRDETEIEASRRLRDAVLANISHEFRTPLSAQLASLELLLDQLPTLTPAQTRDLVLSLQRGTLRLTQLIDNLLESVRLEAGQFKLRRASVAIESVIEQAVETLRPLLDQRHQRLDCGLPDALPIVSGDAPRLTQVFVNLLANANKFAPEGSVIRVGGAASAATMTLWVEDEGPGLPTDEANTLFAPWVRSVSEEPSARGMGLGLWIVKSIVEHHGGQVAARSSAMGTRVSVTLPVEAAHEDSGGG